MRDQKFQLKSDWIWISDWSAEDKEYPGIVYFRKEVEVSRVPASWQIKISASSRYKLYVNGIFVQSGPEKGMKEIGFLDMAELAGYLKCGVNVIAAEVLRYPENSERRNDSIVHTEYPGLYVYDETAAGTLSGRNGWKCKKAAHIRLEAEDFRPAPIHAKESVSAAADFFGWKEAGYDDGTWDECRIYSFFDSKKSSSPFLMKERDIPYMETKEGRFCEALRCMECGRQDEADQRKSWNDLIRSGKKITVAPHSRQVVELSAGELICAYPVWKLAGGKDAKITVLWSECYYQNQPEETREHMRFPSKGDRSDYKNGRLIGYEETYQAVGLGTEERPECYEPYWFKTFRFIRVCVETGEEPLHILDFSYRETGYPLDIKTRVWASDESFAAIWDICERTLRRCMHETYVDCPFYEQLQYVMDSRLEILATYTTAADDRLARQCMEMFRCSQQSDGLLKASAPTEGVNVIPGFSVYFVMMVHDHMMYFGDRALVRHHMNCIDAILEYFERNLSEKGLVGKVGGILFEDPHWSFIDWTDEWHDTIGVPTAALKGDGSLTMESLYYLYGLQLAAELAEFLGREEQKKEYLQRGERLKRAIQKWCIGRQGLLQDGPGVEEYSTHCQIFAVLTDVLTKEEGRKCLEIAIGNRQIAQSSFSMCFYLFRALEKIGWYEKADDLWEMWRKMLRNHMTTCGENPLDGRSECHGWSALLLYELPAVYLGVRPASPGYAAIAVKPTAGHLTGAGGDVITPRGMVHVEWKKDEKSGKLKVECQLPG